MYLASCIPQLESHCAVLEVHGLREEIDANGGLVRLVELVVHESSDDRGLAHAL